MSKFTLDEAIKHCEEVADDNEIATNWQGVTDIVKKRCAECAAEHRQLAEWLRELKERRENKYIAPCGNCCKDCPYSLEKVIEND